MLEKNHLSCYYQTLYVIFPGIHPLHKKFKRRTIAPTEWK